MRGPEKLPLVRREAEDEVRAKVGVVVVNIVVISRNVLTPQCRILTGLAIRHLDAPWLLDAH